MEKRVIIAILLSLAVIVGYPYILKQVYPEAYTEVTEESAVEPEKNVTTSLLSKIGIGEAPAEKAAPAPKVFPVTTRALPGAAEELTTVETPLFKAVFTNHGGAITKWELKKYNATREADSLPVDLVNNLDSQTTNRTSIVINNETEEIVFNSPLRSAYTLDGREKLEFVYSGTTKEGLVVEKRYKFSADTYMVDTEVRLYNRSDAPVTGHIETLMSATLKKETKKSYYHYGPVVYEDDEILRQDSDEEALRGKGALHWIGLENKYFLTVLLPPASAHLNWATEVYDEDFATTTVISDEMRIAPGADAAVVYSTFSGPKLYSLMTNKHIGLEESIEFGFFAIMAKPFLVILNLMQGYLVNYGIAIVLFTVAIKLLFYPLTKHSMTSMKEMQRVQPQLAAIKKRFKDNKEKMNKEVMGLYKKYKINPVSGCLPMVLQIPVFIALYEVLYVAIELRHAPLILWITDLSAKDPYYITPVLMGASMYFQQKMTPSSPDPTQAKMMQFLPIVFTFMFLNFPAGLVLYWLTNNLLSIGQQVIINKAHAAKASSVPPIDLTQYDEPDTPKEVKPAKSQHKGKGKGKKSKK
ncbi:MAG: membrane protein insertase YidC [Proteobacteria bacterium]|nr:membrane protein insertase YidC [Pseudomonadota bacterium]